MFDEVMIHPWQAACNKSNRWFSMSGLAHFRRESQLRNGNTSSDTLFFSSGVIHTCWGAFLVVTWQWLGPLHCRDDLLPPQPVESGHEAWGGVGQRAVVARVDDLWLDGLEHRQHGGHKLGHAPGDHWNRHVADGLWGSRALLHFHLDQLLVFPRWGMRRERTVGKERRRHENKEPVSSGYFTFYASSRCFFSKSRDRRGILQPPPHRRTS